jgi:hypothetical protein
MASAGTLDAAVRFDLVFSYCEMAARHWLARPFFCLI